MSDDINNPAHYASGSGIECIDAIEAALTPEEFRGFIKGNVLKYTWRERNKGGDNSMAKAKWYIERLLIRKQTPAEIPMSTELPKALCAHEWMPTGMMLSSHPGQTEFTCRLCSKRGLRTDGSNLIREQP